MQTALFLAASLATLAQAFTQPGAQTWGPLLTPDTTSTVTQGKDFTVTWDPQNHPTDGVTVSLVLCHGPGSNCVLSNTAIASSIPAAQKSFNWKVPCDLAPGVQSTSTGYGMLIIVDGTGEFQYSTQFTVTASDACSSGSGSGSSSTPTSATGKTASPSTASPTVTASTSGGIVIGPPAYQTESSSGWTSAGANWTSTALASVKSGTTLIVVTSGSSTYTWGSAYTITPTTTTFGTAAATTTKSASGSASVAGAGASKTSPSGSAFTGAAGRVGSSIAGMVVAGAVAVFAM